MITTKTPTTMLLMTVMMRIHSLTGGVRVVGAAGNSTGTDQTVHFVCPWWAG